MKKVSCIICAYNEAPRIEAVLSAVIGHPDIAEVIVVDDGSKDGTAKKAESAGAIVIRHDKNLGKSRAVASGVEKASHPVFLFLDADLKGLTAKDVSALLKPVLSGKADVAISMRKSSYLACRVVGVDFLSGERVIPASLLKDRVRDIAKLTPFGIEVFMNDLVIRNNLSIATVDMKSVVGLHKAEKMGLLKGISEDLKMFDDILKVMPLERMLYQNYAMSLLRNQESLAQLIEMKKLLMTPVHELTKPFRKKQK